MKKTGDYIQLWINNTESLYNYWMDKARELDLQDLANLLKEEITENNPLRDESSMYSDILTQSLTGADYWEIARDLKDSLE